MAQVPDYTALAPLLPGDLTYVARPSEGRRGSHSFDLGTAIGDIDTDIAALTTDLAAEVSRSTNADTALSARVTVTETNITTLQGTVSAIAEGLYAANYSVVGQLASDTPINQTTVAQAAEDAAWALAQVRGEAVDLHWPPGIIYVLNATPRPLVRNILHNTIFKTVADPTYGDYRRTWRIEYNDTPWVDVPIANRDDAFHFGFDGTGAIDGNWLLCSAWTGSVENWEVTNQGTGYTSLPTLTVTGGGGSGMTATPLMGVLTYSVSTGAAAGYVAGDEIIFAAGGGTIFNSTAVRLRVLTAAAGVPLTWELSAAGAFSALATGAMAQASVVSYAAPQTALTGRSGVTLTATTWGLVDVQTGARGTEYYVAGFPEFGGNLALSITGGGGSGAVVVPHWIGDYYKNGVFGTGTNEHNAGLWLRCQQGLSYRPKFYVGEGIQIQNTQGDAFYIGGQWDVDFRGRTNNHFRGGVTIVSGCRFRGLRNTITGYGLGIDVEISGGYWNDTTKLRAFNGPAIVAGGSGYTQGDRIYVPTGNYDKPWTMVVSAVDGSGAVTGFIPISEGKYHATPTSLTAIPMKGGTGSGLTMTHVVGSSALDMELIDVECDTQRGCNIFPFLGRIKITGKIAGDRVLILQSGGGAGDIEFDVDWLCRDTGINISTVLPSQIKMSGSITHRPRNTGAVQNNYSVGGDRQTALMLTNNSGGACTPEAIVNFDNLVIDKTQGNRNSPSYGIQGFEVQYTGTGYTYNATFGDITFKGDYYTLRALQRSGRWIWSGPVKLGTAIGGGISIISDQSVIPNSYGCAMEMQVPPVAGNASPVLSVAQVGANVDARYYVTLGGTWKDTDNLLGSIVSGTVLKIHSGRKIKGSANPPVMGGFVGDTYELDTPVVGQPSGWLCTVSHATAATWVAKANL